MKRSEINTAIQWALSLLESNNILLPEFGYWKLGEWKANKDKLATIKKAMLGWDITDYGLNEFDKIGGVLFTLRNGDQKDPTIGVPYAEKYILLKDGQGLPTHFHFSKTEDIINRAGGVLALKLYNATLDHELDKEKPVEVYCDGIVKTFAPGEVVKITPGGSITLTPYMYHTFWALEGEGDLVCGEVSTVNDDNVDNNFYEKLPRFGDIEEDEDVLLPLCNEYEKWL
jgi:D-lyxose ketol-isomerase